MKAYEVAQDIQARDLFMVITIIIIIIIIITRKMVPIMGRASS